MEIMARVFRFKVDLRKLNRMGGTAPPPRDGFESSELLEESLREEQREQDYARTLEELGPATEIADIGTERPLALDLLRSYNASLKRAQSTPGGRYTSRGIDYNVFFDDWSNKHVVTRPSETPRERVSELVVSPEGKLLRIAFEWAKGPRQPLDDLFETGLCGLEDDAGRLAECPGYELRVASFIRTADLIEDVYQVIYRHDGTRVVAREPEL